MPYPTEHVAKIESVAGFNPTTFLRRKLGGGVSVIIGNRQDDATKTAAQAYRFQSKRFTPDAARKWIKDHDAKILSFEPATNEDSVIKNVAAIMAQTGVEAGLVVNEDGVTAAAKEYELAANAEDNSRMCLVHNLGKLTRVEQHDGIDYLVAPTVLICEGVHNNLYYPPEELSKFCDSWNGRPVVVFHPQNAGKAVTANSPAVWWGKGGSKVGYVFNARWDADAAKLRADIYVDPAKCREAGEHGVRVIDTLENEGPLEVSTGLFTELRQNASGTVEPGTWKGEQYKGVAINHRPDHLALLPGLKGACSWDDGAGTPRVNAEESVTDNAGTAEGAKKAWDKRGRGQKEKEKSVASKFAGDDNEDNGDNLGNLFDRHKIDPSDKSGFSVIGVGWVSGKTIAADMKLVADAGTDDQVETVIRERFGMSSADALEDGSGAYGADRNWISVKSMAKAIVDAYESGSGNTFAPASSDDDYDEKSYQRRRSRDYEPETERQKRDRMRNNNSNYTLNADGVLVNAELSHSQLNETLGKLICARFTPESVAQPGTNPSPCVGPWLVDVYDDCAIFACDGKTWSIEYTSGNEGVELDDGPAQEVQRCMSYEPVNNENNEDGDAAPHNNEEIGMKDEGNMTKEQIAANAKADAEKLAADKKAEEEKLAKAKVMNCNAETLDSVLAGIKDNGLRALVSEGVETMRQEKTKLVEKLVVNGAFTKDELDAMALAGLRKLDLALTKAATPVVNEQPAAGGSVRVAAGAAPVVNASEGGGVPKMPSLFEAKK